MNKLAIVILNYLNYSDTIECLESLKNDNYPNKEIVVVDNNSTNESVYKLEEYCKKNVNVHFIESEENLGFAKGNNLGIVYARKNLNCNFVLLVNNDTVFKDSDMITELMNSYERNVGVIGPRIISADKFEQNPIGTVVTKEKVANHKKQILSFSNKCRQSDLYIKLKRIKLLCKLMSKLFNKNKECINDQEIIIKPTTCSEKMVLHGACMLLTKDYFEYYPYLFPNTFLYYEENILTLLTDKVGLKKKYIANAFIYHKEDQSSLMSFNNSNKVKRKHLLNSIKECEELFDYTYSQIFEKYFKTSY